MFRSKSYCVFGNPMGDMSTIADYYMPVNYEEMFSDKLHQIAAKQEREEQERKRIEAERKAKLLSEQQPMIDEWHGKLIFGDVDGLPPVQHGKVPVQKVHIQEKRRLEVDFPVPVPGRGLRVHGLEVIVHGNGVGLDAHVPQPLLDFQGGSGLSGAGYCHQRD